MVNYGGNSFPQATAETHAERVNIWNYIDHSRSVGVAMLPSTDNPVGKRWAAGTAIQVSAGGILLGSAATAPDGLTRTDVVMGQGGCTFTIVRSGSVRESLLETALTDTQKSKLPCIDFDKEPVTAINS